MLNKQNKMIMKKSLLLAAASLAVISCSKRSFGPGVEEGEQQVRFSSGIMAVPSKVSVDNNGHSKFDQGDLIGVYAVVHGKALGTDGAAAFPANNQFQYLDKKYSVTNIPAYDAANSKPAVAEFAPQSQGVDNMYYLAGGIGWNYYAYYPTSVALTNGMPSGNAATATAANFVKTDNMLTFYNQTMLGSGTTYPGPIIFAHYATEDKAVASGTTQPAVELPFKYAVAKITLDVEVKGAVGTANDVQHIMLYGAGMKQGIVFDLTKAAAKDVTTGVYNVVSQSATGVDLDGTPLNASTGMPQVNTTKAYLFGKTVTLATSNKQASDNNGETDPVKKLADSTLFTSTGYLIPAGNAVATPTGTLTGGTIKFFVGSSNPEVYTASLDKTATGGTNYLPKIEPGKEYKFKIVISKNAVTFTGTIEDWDVVDHTGDPLPAE